MVVSRRGASAKAPRTKFESAPSSRIVIGDCVAETGLARAAIERGGHVRVGLEDFGGKRRPTNLELIGEVVVLAQGAGRPLASPTEAARILGLPR